MLGSGRDGADSGSMRGERAQLLAFAPGKEQAAGVWEP